MAKVKKVGFWERFAKKELSRIGHAQNGDELFILTEEEIAALKNPTHNLLESWPRWGIGSRTFICALLPFWRDTFSNE